jgi:type II secretion system protein G
MNYKLRTKNFLGFTLIELMIVVSILGILAAIVLPEFQSQTQQAKEAAAKANLKILRDAIERYVLDHNGVPPGYANNNPTSIASASNFSKQLVTVGKYISKMPKNPFNDYNGIQVYANEQTFPTQADGSSGWIYQPETKEIRLNWQGTDSEGKSYFSY